MLKITTNGYSLQESSQSDGIVVSACLLRSNAANQWKKSYFFKNSIVDAGDYAFILNVEDKSSEFAEIAIESIQLSSSDRTWSQHLLGVNALQSNSTFEKNGPVPRTAFFVIGANKNSQDPYDIKISGQKDAVTAEVNVVLREDGGSKVNRTWRLPMSFAKQTRYMSNAIAHVAD